MTPVNGHGPPPPEPLSIAIARAVWTANMGEGDAPWDQLTPDEQEYLGAHAEGYIAAHMALLQANGFRILPPGAFPRPKSDEEAAAMLLAVKAYREAKKRKGGLVGSVAPKKLILPPGMH